MVSMDLSKTGTNKSCLRGSCDLISLKMDYTVEMNFSWDNPLKEVSKG
jgi:hypothetical protein